MPVTAPPPPSAPADPGAAAGTGHRTPRLLELGQLLGEWEADASAAFEARTKAVPCG